MQNIEHFVYLLKEALCLATHELKLIHADKLSVWSAEQLSIVIIPEMSELLQYALKGKILHKYGKEQFLLESTYLMTDSLEQLSNSVLGKKLLEIQNLYNSL